MARLRSLFLFGLVLFSMVQVPSANALTVSPVKIELSGDAGQMLSGTFDLYNEQEVPLTFYVSTANFEAEGETGAPKFVESDEGLASWVHVTEGLEMVTLTPDQTQTVDYRIEIPSDAVPGGYFAAIFWGTSPEKNEEEKQLSLGAKVGILLLLTVNGEVDTEGGLLEFDTLDSQRVFTELPVQFYYRFQNLGTNRILPAGALDLINSFGVQTDSIAANADQGNVLPSSIRRFEESWGTLAEAPDGFWDHVEAQWDNFALGYYKADLALTYDESQESEMAATSFWVFPWQLLLVLGLAVTFAFGGLRFLLKRYNAWIIASALEAQKSPGVKPKLKATSRSKVKFKKKTS